MVGQDAQGRRGAETYMRSNRENTEPLVKVKARRWGCRTRHTSTRPGRRTEKQDWELASLAHVVRRKGVRWRERRSR